MLILLLIVLFLILVFLHFEFIPVNVRQFQKKREFFNKKNFCKKTKLQGLKVLGNRTILNFEVFPVNLKLHLLVFNFLPS